MFLILDEAACRLENEAGDVLAVASSFIALLDALDGGVADALVADTPCAMVCGPAMAAPQRAAA